jgi:hypothetical protein
MNAHASEHAGPVNYSDAFARLCRSDGAFLAGWAIADYKKVVFGCTHCDASIATAILFSFHATSLQLAAQVP